MKCIKLNSILCGLAMLFALLCVKTDAGTIGDLNYEILDGEVMITDCKQNAEGELVIPKQIDGLPVTTIDGSAFAYCFSLTSITIPDSVTSIEVRAFENCFSLTSITIPDSVTIIHEAAFFACRSLTSVIIGDSVTIIGDFAFLLCENLTSITIGDSVRTIGHGAFDGCISLISITIPDSVATIGQGAFYECSSLTSITIPNSVNSIGDEAFYECSSLTTITIPADFHDQVEARRLSLERLWPDGFFLPTSSPPRKQSELSIRLPLQLILKGNQNTSAVIEATDSVNGPWSEWRTVVIGEDGTTEVDLDAGAEKRFYRIRN